MATIIQTIEDVKKYVRVGRKDFDDFEAYITDAEQSLVPVLGHQLIRLLQNASSPERFTELKELCKKYIAITAMQLFTPEGSYNIGATGFTVDRSDMVTVASDQKISAAVEGYRSRALTALRQIIEYLEDHAENYPEWAASDFRKNATSTLFDSMRQLSTDGMVDLRDQPELISTHCGVLRNALSIALRSVPKELHSICKQKAVQTESPKEQLRIAVRRFVAVSLLASVTDQDLIGQAMEDIRSVLSDNATELGITSTPGYDNSQSAIFVMP